MLHVALWEPEIPPNTGNVARLCAATGARLHLIGRLGFRLDDRSLKRAGLDYWDAVDVVRHVTFEEFEQSLLGERPGLPRPSSVDGRDKPGRSPGAGLSPRIWLVETPAERAYTRADFADGDCLLFGGESKGLPPAVRVKYAGTLIGIPMPTGKVRSLNLATAVGVVLYEALRQLHDW
jgi:tRNA (cytidine/uridine-2'-O-)-methyltransferase